MTDRVTLIATLAVELRRDNAQRFPYFQPSDFIPDAVRLVRKAEEAVRAEWGLKPSKPLYPRAEEDDEVAA